MKIEILLWDLDIICKCSPRKKKIPSGSKQFTTNPMVKLELYKKDEVFFFHYRFTLIYYYLTLPLIFSYSFRCEEGQKMKKDNLKFSINETSFPDELLLERNNNILHSLRIKILNTKTKTQFNR